MAKLTDAEKIARIEKQIAKARQETAPKRPPLPAVPVIQWAGCYDEGWKGLIVDDAFAHPAKAARALLRKIYDHLQMLGIPPRSVVVDPFGGVGTTAIEGASRGYQVVLCELEPKFAALCEENFALHANSWREMGLPLPRVINGDSRKLREHLLTADVVVSSPPYADQGLMGGDQGTVIGKGVRSNGLAISNGILGDPNYGETDGQLGALPTGNVDAIVSSSPYAGSLTPGSLTPGNKENDPERRQPFEPDNIGNLPEGAVDAVISSPPYANQDTGGTRRELEKYDSDRERDQREYGQMSGLPAGGVDAVISSPPYAEIATGAGGLNTKPGSEGQQTGRNPEAASQDTDQRYGDTSGQLSKMDKGQVDEIISSPPYESTILSGGGGIAHEMRSTYRDGQNYGDDSAQLGAMPTEGVEAVISSPPYEAALSARGGRQMAQAGLGNVTAGKDDVDTSSGRYGQTDGQMGEMQSEGVDAIISSPPYADTPVIASGVQDNETEWGTGKDLSAGKSKTYGETDGQLGAMVSEEVDAVISSPPYEGSVNQTDAANDAEARRHRIIAAGHDAQAAGGHSVINDPQVYGKSDGQIGGMREDTFWSAARDIVAECYAILKPGGYAIWIVKAFVRDKQIVDFPGDWRKLCEHLGFETLTEVRAMLVATTTIMNLFGEEETEKTERKSFFRRLAESKGSPKIDYEVVWIMRKPIRS